mmetsp:Transcript_26639/g.55051  ORF Transcript_26639/g.55051 Transcript_26639/m.55051 type:complete len:797 (+) Transcript_26639:379-2769(+)
MVAAHSRMVNNTYYNAAAAAAVAGVQGSYSNSPKPTITGSSAVANSNKMAQDGSSGDPAGSASNNTHKSAKKIGTQPPQSPPQNSNNSRLSSSSAAPSSNNYPPIPPLSNSDDMKYQAAQVVRMAAAAHAAAGNNGNGGSNFTNSLATAAGTFNPVLLEHIMAQHRGGAGNAGGMDWNGSHGGRQQPSSSGGRGGGDYATHQYPGYPPPQNSGQQQQQHEDIHAKCQRQEAFIAHLQERIQQQERQLLTLCSHILLSPPAPPVSSVNANANNNGNNNAGCSSSANANMSGTNGTGNIATPNAGGGGPHHNGISHPQYSDPQFAAATKMNAAAAVANINNINASVAAVKELQSYGIGGNNKNNNAGSSSKAMVTNERANPHQGNNNNNNRHHGPVVTSVGASATGANKKTKATGAQHMVPFIASSSNANATSQGSKASTNTTTVPSSKQQKSNTGKEKASKTNTGAAPAAKASVSTPAPEKPDRPTADGDAVAALLALGIGKSPGSASPPSATSAASSGGEASSAGGEEENSSKKKRKISAGGRRTLPLKKKQIQSQQQESNKTNFHHQGPSSQHQQQQQQQQQHIHQHHHHHHQQQQQRQQQLSKATNSMMLQTNRAVIPKPSVDMVPAPELYLYGETPIHEPHVHDVLCGRGALTNEHPGNEWFRRLVRSNRQLYRSCPKHTKLLVAKAIVQAVQRTQRNPPGRFLEKTKTADGSVSNTWTPITYKSAVEKASQALREKVTPNWGAPPSNFPLSKALEAARAVAYLEKEYPSGDGFGGTNLLALIMAVVQSAGLD